MKLRSIINLILPAGLIIFAGGLLTAQELGYPKLMNDSIIGLTLDQVDAINFMKIDRDERISLLKLYGDALIEYDNEAIKHKSYIKSLEAAEVENAKYINQLKTDLEKSKRKATIYKNIIIFTVPISIISAILLIAK